MTVDFWSEGRGATRATVRAGRDSGRPSFEQPTRKGVVSEEAGELHDGDGRRVGEGFRPAALFVDRDEGRGVEGNASQRRNGTGRWNPAQGFLVRGQRHRESVGTLVGPIQAGIESGRPSSEPTSQGGERVDTNPHPADARTGPGVQAGARPAFGGWRC